MQTDSENLLTARADDGDLAARLKALPELEPPVAWARIEAAAAVARRRRATRQVGLGIAAGVVVAALAFGFWLLAPEPERLAGSAPLDPTSSALTSVAYEDLLAESARLERLLRELPRRDRVMNAATAGTIVGLEDRVALIDEQLTLATAGGARLEARQVLWQERVEVMNALVQVRYAHVQGY